MAEQQQHRVRQPRIFRDRKDVLNKLSDRELIKRYRLDRAGIVFVTILVREVLSRPTLTNKALTPEMKVLITLRYLGTGKMQLCNGDDLGVSQQTVSRVITETLDALPSQFEAEYVNRKRYHSINVQVVFDAKYRIIDLEAKWPGSVHDSRILNESGLKTMFETGVVPAGCHLLGDSGYGSKTWLLTPYLRPQPGYQLHYNSEIRVTPPAKVCKIIFVCGVLHNICKQRNIQLLLEDDQPPAEAENNIWMDDEEDGDGAEQPPAGHLAHNGLLYREFERLHFK
ncbi:putative nuclease HARBI1 [Portunus trituberculatus]|uniref:putative nuclease HARBI1 n=1 Tax=Portunus trituberculatus TaxID=210409 RepID=UPI001E1CD46C|nr:putative nuclease HARBI1 [Portunus trituberculatus]